MNSCAEGDLGVFFFYSSLLTEFEQVFYIIVIDFELISCIYLTEFLVCVNIYICKCTSISHFMKWVDIAVSNIIIKRSVVMLNATIVNRYIHTRDL